MNGDVGVTSKPAACVDNEWPVGVLPTDLCPVVGGERVDAANVVLWLNTGGAVTKVVCSVGNTGGGGGDMMWLETFVVDGWRMTFYSLIWLFRN